eukprot:824878-Rhodomonas_salina.3
MCWFAAVSGGCACGLWLAVLTPHALSLFTLHCSLITAHRSLRTPHFSLSPPHSSPLTLTTLPLPVLTAHSFRCSPLTAHCFRRTRCGSNWQRSRSKRVTFVWPRTSYSAYRPPISLCRRYHRSISANGAGRWLWAQYGTFRPDGGSMCLWAR